MIKREMYLKKIRPFYHTELIKVITGIRRCGKSVLLQQIQEEIIELGVPCDHIISINFEDLKYAFLTDAMALHQYVTQQMSDTEKYYLFFDEIQNVKQFEKAVNSFRASLNVSIFITGSNSKMMSGELATLLSGRYVSFQIMPFRFREACERKGISPANASEDDLMDYITWGGMPQRFQFQSEEEIRVFLTDLYNSIVLRDIFQKSDIRDIDILNRIVEYLVNHPSQTFSPTSIAKYFECANRRISSETIYQYVEGVTSAMIMHKVRRYDIRGKRILTRSDKYYLTDVGLGNIKNTGFKTEIGPLIENIVCNELLLRGYEVYTGKTQKGEIDFIAIKDGKKEYYQAAYLLATDEVIAREFGAYAPVPDNYPKYVISMDKFDFSRDGVIHRNLLDFLSD